MENTSWDVDIFTPSPSPQGLPKMPPFLDYGLAFFLFITFIFGVAGNGVTIWIFIRTRSLRTAPNMLIVNLAFSDIAMVLTNFPLMFLSTVHGSWLFGPLVCEIYAFCGGLFGFMSITTMTAIALDRHYVICHSMEAIRTVTRKKAAYKILLVWIYSSIWSLLPFFGFGAYVLEGFGVNCTFEYLDLSLKNKLYVATIFIFGFAIPVGIIIACYSHIAYTLRQHRMQLMKVQNDLRTVGNDKAQAAAIRKVKADNVEWQIAKVGIMLTVLFCMSWMPYASVAIIGEFIDSSKITPMVQTIPVVMAKSSACWNPLVYAISHQRFKQALRNHFFTFCCGDAERRQRHSSTRSMSSENRFTESRATSVRSAISEPGKRDRAVTAMSTLSAKTDEIEMGSGGTQREPTRSSLKGGRERENKSTNNEPVATEQRPGSLPGASSTAADTGNVNLIMKSIGGGVKSHEEYVAYDNPALAPDDKEQLTKL